MVEVIGNQLLVGFHEWAWSIRTTGFPVYAIRRIGESYTAIQIGTTKKQMTRYNLPSDTVAVFREYVTNKGYHEYHVYVIRADGIKSYTLSETSNFEIPETKSEETRKILEYVREWALNNRI